MITFAGIGLIPPDDAQEAVNQWWHGHQIAEFEQPYASATGRLNHLPVPAQARQGPPRIGVLNWPTLASRFAVCHLVASGDQVALVRAAVGPSPTAQTLSFDDGVHPAVTCSMWMLPPRPISQRGDGKEQYLLTLVDDRYWWWDAGYSTLPTFPTSWSSLLGAMISSVGASGRIPPIPSGYGTPNESRWSVGKQPLPLLIDAASQTVGLRLVRDLDGSNRLFTASESATEDATQWATYRYEVLSGGQMLAADIGRSVPASVAVTFPGATPATTTVSLASLGITEYGGTTGVADKSAQVVGDLAATDTSGQAAYAVQAARDYYLWALSRTDCTIRGLVARPMTGMEDRVEWIHPASGEMVTRVYALPFSDRNQYGTIPEQTRVGRHARLTTSSDGKWKWVALTLNGAGEPVDDGVEATTFNAVPLKVPGTIFSVGEGGDRVWMLDSKQNGFYEFISCKGYAPTYVEDYADSFIANFGGPGNTIDQNVSINLEPGTYLVLYSLNMGIYPAPTRTGYVRVFAWNDTTGATIPRTTGYASNTFAPTTALVGASDFNAHTVMKQFYITVTETTVIKLRAVLVAGLDGNTADACIQALRLSL